MRSPSKREWILLACVPAVFLFAAGTEGTGEELTAGIVEPRHVARTQDSAPQATGAGALDLSRLRRDVAKGEPRNVFTSKSWYVPPPPPPPPPPRVVVVAPPTAPPLPFTFLGRYVDAGAPTFFLVKGDRVLTVKVGDVIEGIYRVDGVVGSSLGLTYLPLNIKQQLDMGNA